MDPGGAKTIISMNKILLLTIFHIVLKTVYCSDDIPSDNVSHDIAAPVLMLQGIIESKGLIPLSFEILSYEWQMSTKIKVLIVTGKYTTREEVEKAPTDDHPCNLTLTSFKV